MILFIPNIPANTKNDDLRDFVDPALKSGFILRFRLGNIVKLEEMCIRDKASGHFEHHGLVYIDTYKAGLRAIKRLNDDLFGSRPIEIRKFATRKLENDRRLTKNKVPFDILERRQGERRRNNAQVEILKRNFL